MAREPKSDFSGTDWHLTFVLLAPPSIWFAHLNVSYSLVQTWCDSPTRWLPHAVTLAALAGVVAVGFSSWRSVEHFGRGPIDQGESTETRRRFMAILATVFSLFFALSIVAVGIANFVIRSCG